MSKALHFDVGQRFDRLTVIARASNIGRHAGWLCKCECGNELIVPAGSLRTGNVRSCGCLLRDTRSKNGQRSRLRFAPGLRFGRLTVLDRADNVGAHGAWNCLCDCGVSVTVIAGRLSSGNTRSCGCLALETSAANGAATKKHGHANPRSRRGGSRRRHMDRGLR